jgi:TRAP-type mannitol/chloroaromatic compound transport system substrate-binding protein
MTRIVVALLLCGAMCLSLMGCAPEAPSTPTAPTTPTSPTTPTKPTTPSAPAEKPIVWNLQTPYPEASYLNDPARDVCSGITLASGGRLEVKFFSAGNIVPAKGEFDAVDSNVIQMCLSGFGYTTDKWPNGSILDAKPGTMSHLSTGMWWDLFGGIEFGQEMIGDYNVKLLRGATVKTPEPFLHTRVKINSLQDLKGLKVRSYGESGVLFERLGVNVVYLSAGETYEAAQRGVIDGFELGTIAGNISYSAHEVAKYIYLGSVRAPYANGYFMVNDDQWNSLPADLQALAQDVVSAKTNTWNGSQIQEDIEALEFFKDYGCEVYAIPADVKAACVTEIDAMYAEIAASDPFLARVLENMAAFEEAFNTAESLHNA